MSMKMINAGSIKLMVFIVITCFTSVFPSLTGAQEGVGTPFAVVEGVQGPATLAAESGHKPENLTYGTVVHSWETIATSANSKLLLKSETGMLTSLGGLTSIYLGSEKGETGSVHVLEMSKGVLRVTKQGGGGNVAPYKVTVPEGYIEPVDYDAPVDFIVETYSPTMSIITVITGPVRVSKDNMNHVMETAVADCHSVFLDKGWLEPHVVTSNSNDIGKLMNQTTIPGTVGMNLACPMPTWPF
jgi:hypothetical protein